MKSIMLSIQPKWCKLIANGKKTIEVRKTAPKLEVPFKCFIYCTYGQGLIKNNDAFLTNCLIEESVTKKSTFGNCCNGKVIGEFVCNYIELIKCCGTEFWIFSDEGYSCLSFEELLDYSNGKNLYGWHISDLKIYDEPKELSEFYTIQKSGSDCCIGCEHHECPLDEEPCKSCTGERKYLYRAPQSWCYVEEL